MGNCLCFPKVKKVRPPPPIPPNEVLFLLYDKSFKTTRYNDIHLLVLPGETLIYLGSFQREAFSSEDSAYLYQLLERRIIGTPVMLCDDVDYPTWFDMYFIVFEGRIFSAL